MRVRNLLAVAAVAALVGAGIGTAATLYFAERGPVGETGPRGSAGPEGPPGESADDVSFEVDDLQARVDDLEGELRRLARGSAMPKAVAEDLNTLADAIEEAGQIAVDNCGQLGEPAYVCRTDAFTLNAPAFP